MPMPRSRKWMPRTWLRGEQRDAAEHAIGASEQLIVVEMRRIGQNGLEFRNCAARIAAPVVHSSQPIVAVRDQAAVGRARWRRASAWRITSICSSLVANWDAAAHLRLISIRRPRWWLSVSRWMAAEKWLRAEFEREGLDCAVPCQLEIAHGAVEVVIARVVKGQGLAIFLGPAARQLLDGLRHQSVQLLALLEQQRLVRDVLDDDVLESEARLRLVPNRRDETELLELRDDPVEIDIRSDEPGEDRQRELTPNDSGAAQDISPGRLEPVETSPTPRFAPCRECRRSALVVRARARHSAPRSGLRP